MRIARFTVDDNLHFGLVEGEPGSETLTVLSGDPFYTGINPTDKRYPIADVRLLAPIIPRSKVIGVARNWRDHASELGNETPTTPQFFFKPTLPSSAPAIPSPCPNGQITSPSKVSSPSSSAASPSPYPWTACPKLSTASPSPTT